MIIRKTRFNKFEKNYFNFNRTKSNRRIWIFYIGGNWGAFVKTLVIRPQEKKEKRPNTPPRRCRQQVFSYWRRAYRISGFQNVNEFSFNVLHDRIDDHPTVHVHVNVQQTYVCVYKKKKKYKNIIIFCGG